MDFLGPHFSFHGSGHGVFIINTHDVLQQIRMFKILMVYHIYLSCHAQVLNGQSRHLPFFQFVCAGAPCQYGNAEMCIRDRLNSVRSTSGYFFAIQAGWAAVEVARTTFR